tara:strand:+ start:386 stop:1093 length:708 start_codon:yes stop_codon:yes gene_type:complete
MLGFLPGMSIDDIARREVDQGDLDQYGKGFDDTKRGAFNWQDQVGAFLAGGTKEDVLRRAQEIRNTKLRNQYSDEGELTRTALSGRGLTPTYTGVEGKSEKQIQQAQAQDEARLRAYQNLAATKGYTPGLVSPSADVIDINAATRNLLEKTERERKQEAKDEKAAAIRREQQRFDTNRSDRLTEQANTLAFQRDQMMLEDRRYNERLEREFQLRRKESIMQMMQGLASLGAAFAM